MVDLLDDLLLTEWGALSKGPLDLLRITTSGGLMPVARLSGKRFVA
jgi:hypothetical protein